MEQQFHAGFASYELNYSTANFYGDPSLTSNAKKRPFPFATEADVPLSSDGRSSPSVNQNLEPLYLLGSLLSRHGKVDILALNFPTSSIIFEVSLIGDYFDLLSSRQAVGRLNKSFCNEARRLVNLGIKFYAYLSKNNWDSCRRALHKPSPEQDVTTFTVDISVWSFRHHADRIGDIFSQAGFFLQRPTHTFSEQLYYNPQVLDIKDFEATQETTPSFTRDARWNQLESSTVPCLNRTESENSKNAPDVVDSILNSLTHNGILHEIQTDQNEIRTPLLPHQMKAIDFIRQRENSNLPSSLSLWKEKKPAGEKQFFQHVLTQAKRPQRDEARSGIIADDMGLGKTLVVLSAITGSLSIGNTFASNYVPTPAAQTALRATRATLILAPSTLLIDSWINEISLHTYPGSITFHKHLGSERRKSEEIRLLFERDIVFTTFATVASEFGGGDSPLSKIHWFRIVLDEAHEIRNRSTKQFQAVHALNAQHRWCLTGTPIQNSLEDLGALMSFLRIPILEKVTTFRRYIITPTTSNSGNKYRNLQTLLQSVCLRRTREILGLPETLPQEKRIAFSDRERSEYNELYRRFGNLVQKAVSGQGPRVSATALHCIHELRLFCNNGLRKHRGEGVETNEELFSGLMQYGLNTCDKCSGPIFSISQGGDPSGGTFISPCTHLVCHSCLPQCYKNRKDCLLCFKGHVPVRPSSSTGLGLPYPDENGDFLDRAAERYPSKLLALMEDLRSSPWNKCIIFSSWKKTLDLAGQLLDSQSLRYEFIHGGLTLSKRLKVLSDFKSPTGPNILLMTLGTGAVGLNLAVASHIYILEPQWNPFIEFQAMARAQRIGQTKQVVIIRYIMENTIEQSNVLRKQKKKTALAGDGFGKQRLSESLEYFGVQASRRS